MVSLGFEPTHILVQPKLDLNAVTTLPRRPLLEPAPNLKIHQPSSKFHYKKL